VFFEGALAIKKQHATQFNSSADIRHESDWALALQCGAPLCNDACKSFGHEATCN
jgi:hypothetical protein